MNCRRCKKPVAHNVCMGCGAIQNRNPCGEITLGMSEPVMPWVQIELMCALRAKQGLPPYSQRELDEIREKLENTMLVKCERDGTIFSATVVPYPSPHRQSKFHSKDGDRFIECPTCGRRYFYQDGVNFDDEIGWVSDRQLTILEN